MNIIVNHHSHFFLGHRGSALRPTAIVGLLSAGEARMDMPLALDDTGRIQASILYAPQSNSISIFYGLTVPGAGEIKAIVYGVAMSLLAGMVGVKYMTNKDELHRQSIWPDGRPACYSTSMNWSAIVPVSEYVRG